MAHANRLNILRQCCLKSVRITGLCGDCFRKNLGVLRFNWEISTVVDLKREHDWTCEKNNFNVSFEHIFLRIRKIECIFMNLRIFANRWKILLFIIPSSDIDNKVKFTAFLKRNFIHMSTNIGKWTFYENYHNFEHINSYYSRSGRQF